jgi:AbrB family looped-hinge helix DNA binding protein
VSTATITSKGQITLPKSVRDALGVGPGDRIEFVRQDDGAFHIAPVAGSVMALKGLITPPDRPVTIEEMEAAIAAGARSA